ncbi:MAG: LptF/LptG family permease, partial [Pseudomonadota bacterium]
SAGLMVYIRDRDNVGTMHGLIIHDSRAVDKPASTIIASKGILVSSDKGQQVVVYKGSRQELDAKTGALRRLDFDTYTVDLPVSERDTSVRINEPDERTLNELLQPLKKDERAQPNLKRQVRTEIQKRFLSPLLVPSFSLVGMSFLLLGGYNRRGQSARILSAVAAIMALQILYLSSYHLAKQSALGFPLMAITAIGPIIISYIFLRRGPLSFIPLRRP